MNCEEIVQYLSDYIDKGLDEELAEKVRAHLACCHNCQVVFDSTQKTIILYKKNVEQAIPLERRSALYERLRSAMRDCIKCPEKR